MDMHASAFIEMQRTGQILGINAETNLALAPPIELVERMAQQGKTNALFAPLTAHAQRSNPSHVRVFKGIRPAQVNASNFPGGSIHCEEHQGGIRCFIFPEMLEAFQALFKRLVNKAKMVTEGVGLDSIDSFSISLKIVCAESNSFWKYCFGCWPVHFNEHLIETADVVIPQILQKLLWFFCFAVCASAWRKAEIGGQIWKCLQGASFCPFHQPCADSLVFVIGIHAAPYPWVDRRLGSCPC